MREIYRHLCATYPSKQPIEKYKSFNAMVETVFKTIKNELIWRTSFQSRTAAELALGRYIADGDEPAEAPPGSLLP